MLCYSNGTDKKHRYNCDCNVQECLITVANAQQPIYYTLGDTKWSDLYEVYTVPELLS